MPKSPYSPADDQKLMAHIWALKHDPLNFVRFVYPWGKEKTPLEHHTGPRDWQAGQLREIGEHIRGNLDRLDLGLTPEVWREATSSGRGVGKSAEVSWLEHWMLSCFIGSTVIVSANTEAQLKSITWAEMGKWLAMAINSHWFDINSANIKPSDWLASAVRDQLKIDSTYWYAEAKLWKEENPDAYAGAHNPLGMMVIFDEASGIPAPIWKVAEGYFTEPVLHRYWFAYSNPRRNTGAFFECFHKNRNFWRNKQIDSRTVEGTDKVIYQKIIDQYGEDSDEARVEVKGQFPRQGDQQFNSREVVALARSRKVEPDAGAPLVMGVDVARFGDDASVISFRQGRDARVVPWQRYKGLDTQQLAARVAEWADKVRPDAIFVDGGGVGGGVVDRLKALKYRVFEVQFGAKADDPVAFANRRSELWSKMRDWLQTGAIPDMQELEDDLLGPEYALREPSSTLQLEPKDSMKKRGLASPDWADALANTFDRSVARRDMTGPFGRPRDRRAAGVDYQVLG